MVADTPSLALTTTGQHELINPPQPQPIVPTITRPVTPPNLSIPYRPPAPPPSPSETEPPEPSEADRLKFFNDVARAEKHPIKIFKGIRFIVKDSDLEDKTRTDLDFIGPYFAKAQKAQTFGELTAELQEAVSSLRNLGIFQQVNVHLSELPPALAAHLPNSCQVEVLLVEKRWYTISFGYYVTDEGPQVQVEGSLRNVLGKGETAFGQLSSTAADYTSLENVNHGLTYTLGLRKPLQSVFGRNAVLNILAHNSIFDNLQWSNNKQRTIGTNIRLDVFPHSFSYEGAWRNITLGGNPTEMMLREEGSSFKSSVKYMFSKDFRDSVSFPTRGYAYSFSSELAGLGGDVKFAKNEFSFNYNIPLLKSFCPGWAINYVMKAGLVTPLAGDRVRVCDRFFMGGPGAVLSLRGVNYRGIDPGNPREARGGDLYYTTAAHLTFPLPFMSHIPFVRGHVFANGGNLVPVNSGRWREVAEQLQSTPRSTAGVGLIFSTPFGGRFEFNFYRPLSVHAGDKFVSGRQFGVFFTI